MHRGWVSDEFNFAGTDYSHNFNFNLPSMWGWMKLVIASTCCRRVRIYIKEGNYYIASKVVSKIASCGFLHHFITSCHQGWIACATCSFCLTLFPDFFHVFQSINAFYILIQYWILSLMQWHPRDFACSIMHSIIKLIESSFTFYLHPDPLINPFLIKVF